MRNRDNSSNFKIVIFSSNLKRFILLVQQFGSEYEICRCGYDDYVRNTDIIKEDAEKCALFVVESEYNYLETLKLVKQIRQCAFNGLLLLISDTLDRNKQINEKIDAIDAGADEYIGGTQSYEEIAASVKALLRRFSRNGDCAFNIRGKSFQINPQTRKLYMNGNSLPLTRTEFDIVNYLVIHRNRVVSYKELYEAVWEKEYLHDDMNIMAHIHRIRKRWGMIQRTLYIYRMYTESAT